jgi:hypothetical protein
MNYTGVILMTRQEINFETKKKITALIHELGRFPKIQELAAALNMNVYQTQLTLKSLVEEGFLTMQGNWYRLAPSVSLDTPKVHTVSEKIGLLGQYERTVPEPPGVWQENNIKLPEKVTPEVKEKSDWTIMIIRFCMGFVGVGALILSLYNTYIWQRELSPPFLAGVLSAIVVVFSVFAFEIVLLFVSKEITDKWWRWLVSLIFGILWSIVAIFSITSTIAGQYNQHVSKLVTTAKENLTVTANQEQWALLEEKKTQINDQIAGKKTQLSDYKSILVTTDEKDPKNKGTINDTRWHIVLVNRDIDKLNKDLTATIAQQQEALNKNPEGTSANTIVEKTLNFYTWVATILGKDENTIQFWMNLFPAVFVDIIAPMALAIALFLKRRKKNN